MFCTKHTDKQKRKKTELSNLHFASLRENIHWNEKNKVILQHARFRNTEKQDSSQQRRLKK